MDGMRVQVDIATIEAFEERYGERLVDKALQMIDLYTRKIRREAQKIIKDEDYRDTGQLIRRITPSLQTYGDKVVGEVNAETDYAIYIHDGAYREDHSSSNSKVRPHFVPFSVAPSLLQWAKRNKKIQQIQGRWYFIGKDNQEYPINIDKGGMMVMTRPTKFFEKPYEEIKDKYVEDMAGLIND